MNCQACNAMLLPTSTERDQLVRCGDCGSTFLPLMTNKAALEKTDRMAKWSFWLGLSSLVLLMFTGIPALVLGIRSLRRMRFRTVDKREKFQAITGTVLGLLFGVFGGGCAILVAIVIGFFVSTYENTEDPDRVMAIANSVASFDNTLQLDPDSAFKFLNFKILQFGERDEEKKRFIARFSLIEFHMQPDPRNLRKVLNERFVGLKSDYKFDYTEELDWETQSGGKIKLDVFVHSEYPDMKVLRYWSLQNTEMSWFGVSLVHDPTRTQYSEEEVKSLFESVDPKLFQRQ